MTAQSTVATQRWGVPAIVTLAAMAPREAGEPIMAIVSMAHDDGALGQVDVVPA